MRRWAVLPAILGAMLAWPASADPVRTMLQQGELPTGAYTVKLGHVLVRVGDTPAWHVHAGIETGYILTGHAVMSVAGRPDVALGPGQSFLVPPGVRHASRAVGGDVTLVATWIVEKGAPLATPAAPPAAR